MKTSTIKIEDDKFIIKGTLLKYSPSSIFNQWNGRYCFLTEAKFTYNENNL
jgi:hypothetical protein